MSEPTKRPNIVFVLTDDQGYGDLGCHGAPLVRTPNLDAFHGDSVRLTDFHVGPTCAPTRAGLLTGHYSTSAGVWHTIGGRSLLRKNEWTLATALRDAGYRTGIFGKWHLGDAYPYRPHDRGFEVAMVHGGGGVSQTPDWWGNDYFDDTYYVNGEPKEFEGYCTDVWFREALRFIEHNKDRPFFCYIPTNAPHGPCNVAPEYREPYNGKAPDRRACFFGMITNIDENFAGLRRRLRELNLEDNTILIFMTDNGSAYGVEVDERGFVIDDGGFNAGMRGRKGWEYDGGHRVPFFLRWPAGGMRGGRDMDRLAANVDFMPTLLDLCGVETPEGRTFHGTSVAPLLRDAAAAGDWPDRSVVVDVQRLVRPVKWRKCAVMTQQWRLVNGKELHDMQADPGQRHDLAAERPDVVERLRADYEAWWDVVSAQMDEEIPISLGAEATDETTLVCHDWRNEECSAPHAQSQVRQGRVSNGYWEVDVERAGEYEIELRRWPRSADRAITAGIEGTDVGYREDGMEPGAENAYSGGVALPLTRARLRVGEQEREADIGESDKAVVFRLELPEGPTHLQTWLTDGDDLTLGAYYVYVRRLEQ